MSLKDRKELLERDIKKLSSECAELYQLVAVQEEDPDTGLDAQYMHKVNLLGIRKSELLEVIQLLEV